jgi:hypothetical protein
MNQNTYYSNETSLEKDNVSNIDGTKRLCKTPTKRPPVEGIFPRVLSNEID